MKKTLITVVLVICAILTICTPFYRVGIEIRGRILNDGTRISVKVFDKDDVIKMRSNILVVDEDKAYIGNASAVKYAKLKDARKAEKQFKEYVEKTGEFNGYYQRIGKTIISGDKKAVRKYTAFSWYGIACLGAYFGD